MTKKVLLTTLLLIAIVFCVFEYTSFLYVKNNSRIDNINHKASINGDELRTVNYAPVQIFIPTKFRETEEGSKDKGSILFFGCSYMEGVDVKYNETLPYLINKRTNRTAINRGAAGAGVINMLYELKHKNLYDELKNYAKPQYIIFTLSDSHLPKMHKIYSSIHTNSKNPEYKIIKLYDVINNQVKEVIPPTFTLPFYYLYIMKSIDVRKEQNKNNKKQDSDKMYKFLLEAKKITDKKFPDSKFIIITYSTPPIFTPVPNVLLNNLKHNGFIILDAENLAGHKLNTERWMSRNGQPTAETYRDISKGLIKELNL